MLFAPTQVSPSNQSGLGSGVIDATDDLIVSWAVNGNSDMTAYQIVIYENDANSTQKFSTGKVNLSVPFSGKTNMGTQKFFEANTITASQLSSAGIINGGSYKLVITQWWSANESVVQPSASAFITRTKPTIQANPRPLTINSRSYTFNFDYSQEQGDSLNYIRYYIYKSGQETEPLFDSGNIYGTTDLSITYDGFFSGDSYAIKCDIQTSNGIDATTNFLYFQVSYTTQTYEGQVAACQSKIVPAVELTWQYEQPNTKFSVYRLNLADGIFAHIADTPSGVYSCTDYGTESQTEYQYYIYALDNSDFANNPMVSERIEPIYWNPSIIECDKEDEGLYVAKSVTQFSANVETGEMSNNNSPQMLTNFTPYPLRQPDSSNYRTGTLTAFLGKVNGNKYIDTEKQLKALYALSVSTKPKFLKLRKGAIIQIETSQAITAKTGDNYREQPYTVKIPWVEVGNTSEARITSRIINGTDMKFIAIPNDSFELLDGTTLYVKGEEL